MVSRAKRGPSVKGVRRGVNLKRLRAALEDGVPLRWLSGRFGVPVEALRRMAKELKKADSPCSHLSL
jgi:hypothetical protein